jgi:hypothetical protein
VDLPQHSVEVVDDTEQQEGDGGVELLVGEGQMLARRVDHLDRRDDTGQLAGHLGPHTRGRLDGHHVFGLRVIRKITSGARPYFDDPPGQITDQSRTETRTVDSFLQPFRKAVVLPGQHVR